MQVVTASKDACLVLIWLRWVCVWAGGARVKDCLESHRDDAGFSAECKEEFESMMEARAADFRLDSELSEACASDIEDICGYERVRVLHSPAYQLCLPCRMCSEKSGCPKC